MWRLRPSWLLLQFVFCPFTKPELCPAETCLRHCPESLSKVLPCCTSCDVNWEEMVKGGMGSSRIWSLRKVRQRLFALTRWSHDCVFEGLVKAHRVGQWFSRAQESHVTQIVNCHARCDDLNVVIAKLRQGLTEAVMLDGVLRVEERNLHNWDVQRIRLGIKHYAAIN